MLRFLCRFQTVFKLKSGWIEPLQVGGHAPISPNDHYKCQLDNGALGEFLYQEISLYGRAKFYLLHTFSHVLMKELEFTCGYPTASLSEQIGRAHV